MTSWVVKQWKEISHAGGLDEVLAGSTPHWNRMPVRTAGGASAH
jgi:hypothetical protein